MIVDAVNTVEEARDRWRSLTAGRGVPMVFIEVMCSDPAVHRRISGRWGASVSLGSSRVLRASARGQVKGAGMSFRLAAYAVCIEGGRVLLARWISPEGESNWTLPGGKVEHGEDPFDAVIREVAEETGCDAVVERLLGVDSRVIPAAERTVPGGPEHQNVGVFYQVRITGGTLRPEPNGAIAELVWTPVPDVTSLRRSSLVDIGLALAETLPPTGHVAAVPVGGLVQH